MNKPEIHLSGVLLASHLLNDEEATRGTVALLSQPSNLARIPEDETASLQVSHP